MKISEKKALAESLFIKSSLNRKEIALQIGITEKTLRSWIDNGNWETIKDSQTITRSKLLMNAYQQLNAIDKEIHENFGGIPNKMLSDAQGVLVKKIESLSRQPIHKYVEVFEDFLSFLSQNHPENIQTFMDLSRKYLDSVAKNIN